MRRTASEVIRNLEARIARLERRAAPEADGLDALMSTTSFHQTFKKADRTGWFVPSYVATLKAHNTIIEELETLYDEDALRSSGLGHLFAPAQEVVKAAQQEMEKIYRANSDKSQALKANIETVMRGSVLLGSDRNLLSNVLDWLVLGQKSKVDVTGFDINKAIKIVESKIG